MSNYRQKIRDYLDTQDRPACLSEKFNSYVMPVPESGCFIYLGCETNSGYGRFRVGNKTLLAHRFAWSEINGPIPDGLQVCHKCDTKLCCNPAHLFVGTALENKRDCVHKGRQSKGRRNSDAQMSSPHRKLTAAKAMLIFTAKGRNGEIAREFNVSHTTVSNIKTKTRWIWIHERDCA